MLRPLGAKLVRASKGAVTAANDERVNAVLDEVVRGLAPALNFPERGAPGGADEGATDAREPAHVVPADLRNALPVSGGTPVMRENGRGVRE